MLQATDRELERFYALIKPNEETGCWEWQGSKHKKGYGRFRVGSKENNNRRVDRAHRWSYSVFKGSIGELLVCHKCDNPSCVNPEHLFLGTHEENMEDMRKKGRRKLLGRPQDGENNVNARLTAKDVEDICKRIVAGETNRAIAERYNIGDTMISSIRCKKAWAKLECVQNLPDSKYASLRQPRK